MARSRGKPASEVDFSDPEQARSWFRRQPREMCIALAMRSALRVLPLIETDRVAPDLMPHVTLSVFRACFVAFAIATYPFERSRLRSNGGQATRSVSDFVSGITAAYVASLAAYLAETDATAADAAAEATAIAVRAADVLPDDLPYILDANLDFAEAAVQADAIAMEEGCPVAEIVAAPLWPGEMPERIVEAWNRLRTWMLDDQANHWDPWVVWYERVRDGRPSFSEAFDLAVASLTDEEWNEEPRPAAVNRRIAALLAEHTNPDPIPQPEPIPSQGPGPHFALGPDHRIALALAAELDANGNNLRRLREQLPEVREAADDLAGLLNRNECPELVRNLARYRASLESEPETIAWGVVYSRGVRLDNAAAAARRQIEDRLQPPLEDAAQEALDSLLSLHGPMILATAEGRVLMEDADRMNLTREQQAALRRDALAVAAALNEDSEIIEKPAAEVVGEAVETIGEDPHPERGSVIGSAAIRNVTILTVGIGAVAATAGVGFVQAAAAVVAIEGLKKSKRFSALTDMLGARIDGVLRTGKAFQEFIVRNEQPLRQIATNSAGMRWMLPYIDEIVRRNAGRIETNRPRT